jgi:RNA polymerase I-specific transcription initiation factor RRN5
MSQPTSREQSHEATDNDDNGEPEAVDGSATGEGSEPEEAKRGSPETEGEREDGTGVDSDHREAKRSSKEGRSASRKGRLTRPQRPLRRYREVLNDDILGISRPVEDNADDQLLPSQMGASWWTHVEKQALFRKLASCGPGELRLLSKAIGTKSESEVQVYLQLLQEGVVEARATFKPRQLVSLADQPAAVEVGGACESAVESAADALARMVAERDLQAEQERHEDVWLLDAEATAEIEQVYDAEVEKRTDEAEASQDEAEAALQVDGGALFPSAALLRPEAFIQLSGDLYMAGKPGDESRWYEAGDHVDDMTEPAILRTAFDDMHNLVVSFTRRIVQATLFQAMSRLRAGDGARRDWHPKLEVAKVDVRAALDVLEIDNYAWSKYWASLPRRAGLAVYSDIEKYRKGRRRTNYGVRLTHDEAEAELGLHSGPPVDPELESVSEDELEPADFDSDDFTLVDENELSFPLEHGEVGAVEGESTKPVAEDDVATDASEDPPGSPAKAENAADDEGKDVSRPRVSRKRQRALSPASFAQAETSYLEALDRNASRQEEKRLWKLVRRKPPEEVRKVLIEQVALPPLLPIAKDSEHHNVGEWRAKVRYETAWERYGGPVGEDEFEEIERLGRLGRKRRKILREKMLDRQVSDEVESEGSQEESIDGHGPDDGAASVDIDHGSLHDDDLGEEQEDEEDEDEDEAESDGSADAEGDAEVSKSDAEEDGEL